MTRTAVTLLECVCSIRQHKNGCLFPEPTLEPLPAARAVAAGMNVWVYVAPLHQTSLLAHRSVSICALWGLGGACPAGPSV